MKTSERTKRERHPALNLFRELFDKAAARRDLVAAPSYFVPRSAFIAELKKRGIEHPSKIVDIWRWEGEIGLTQFAKKTIRAYKSGQSSTHETQIPRRRT